MIAFIQGELCEVGQDTIIVACQGIGYEIQVPVSVAQSLPDPGSRVKIYTYTYVREDALGLFGFLTRDDLTVFKLLITVNGVGPKAALAILSSMTADELRFAILAEDAKAISKAPGIGPKTAKRMIIELKDKLVKMIHISVESPDAIQPIGVIHSGPSGEAIEALVSLGYAQKEVEALVESLNDGTKDVSALIKACLVELGKGR